MTAPPLALEFDLLRVFDQLHRERHLSRAARQLGLSQPATSRALARLREVFGDPLFVRAPRGILPTPRAEQLAPEVRELLQRASALVRPPDLDPRTLARDFVIAGVDFLEGDLLPRLARVLADEAPRAALTSRPLGADVGEALASGRVDLAIGVPSTLPPDAMTTHLFDDAFVCVVRDGHPSVRRTLSLTRFAALSHVLISPRGEPGSPVDTALEAQGLRRRIAVRTHTFLSAPLIVAQTDLVLTGPRRVLVPMAAALGLRLLPPPLPLRSFPVHMAWHPRVQNDPVHAWLRGLVRRSVKLPSRPREAGAAEPLRSPR
ncbi:MAG: LysR family transcriptional regulator [Sandaracinaceae bacterium]